MFNSPCDSWRAYGPMQAPLLAYNHFVEAVFVLNECRAGLHASGPPEEPLSQTVGSGAEARGAFSLTGQASRAKRDTIYRCADFPLRCSVPLDRPVLCAWDVSPTQEGE